MPTDKQEVELIFQVANLNYANGGLRESPVFGSKQVLVQQRESLMALQLLFIGSVLIFGGYYLLLFILQTKNKTALIFSILCFITALRSLIWGELKLMLQVYDNSNSIVYFSTDGKAWTEVEGAYSSATKSYRMDISWVSVTSDVKLYFKGDVVKTEKTIILPAQNTAIKVVFNKVDGDLTFSNVTEADTFEWRKSTDYYWNQVEMDESSTSYEAFLSDMENVRSKAAKISIRIPQEVGNGAASVGMRPSKEVSVTITSRGNAPIVKVNSAKLSINTDTSMEYYNSDTTMWEDCSRTMTVEELAPKALYENGSKDVTIMIRTAAISSKPYFKTAYITIPGQTSAPTIGDSYLYGILINLIILRQLSGKP